MQNHVEVADTIISSIVSDLRSLYASIGSGDRINAFYRLILSANPKFYPISGFHHFCDTALIALRLATFLGLDNYDVLVAFLSGLIHDFNKWYISIGDIKKAVYESFAETNLYRGLACIFDEKKVEQAFDDAVELATKLERGGVPRRLQKIAEIVRVGDILTGSEKSWNISYCINVLCSHLGIDIEQIVPAVIGKQRPVVPIISEVVGEELEKQGATPLISTPEGMIFLKRKEANLDVDVVYRALADHVVNLARGVGNVKPAGKKRGLSIGAMKNFLVGTTKELQGLSGPYKSIANYSPNDIEYSFNYYAVNAIDDLRVFIVVLANIYRKCLRKKDNERVRLRKFVEVLQLPDNLVRGVYEKRSIGDMLKALYDVLKTIDSREALVEVARRAKDFVVSEMKKLLESDVDALTGKLANYISIRNTSLADIGRVASPPAKVCSICREPVVSEMTLTSFLQSLQGGAIKAEMSTSEVFHPDVQGKPEKKESIEDAKTYPVCELCFFEVKVVPERLKCMDGMWAAVLQYYPAVSIDLIKAVKTAIVAEHGREITVIPDYMTSRVITSASRRELDKDFLLEALNMWFVFGGNLVVTTTALSTAFISTPLPIELEVSDVVIEEAVSEYMRILEIARKKGRYITFTKEMRYWLYRTLRDYIANLEEKTGAGRGSLKFLRSGLQLTGFATVDVYSYILKQ